MFGEHVGHRGADTMAVTEKPRGLWRRLFAVVLVLLLLGLLGVAAVYLGPYQAFRDSRLNVPDAGRIYEVSPGTSLNRLAHALHREAIIDHPRFFILLGRELDVARRLQAGQYRLDPAMTPQALLEALARGAVVQQTLTLIEGQTFREMLALVHASDELGHTLKELDAGGIMAALGHADEHPEGRFLPDTYHFPMGTTDREFLLRAYRAMDELLAKEWADREPDLPLESAYEALILASIVEKETGLAAERPLIAGVFISRLEKGMRLQTDPTVIYGLGEDFDGNIRSRDLRADTPYNTYTRAGLPPTPIAMPGADAIRAVLHPDRKGYLYFVSRGNGAHYFSRTLEEHNRAVQKFQLGSKNIKLSEPDQSP
jgi:UPF0755 protein